LKLGGVSDHDEPVPKGQDLVDQAAQLILVVEDDRVDAGIDPYRFKVNVWISLEGKCPVVTENVLAADGTATVGNNPRDSRRGEDDVAGTVGQDSFEVAGVPGLDSLVGELARLRRAHGGECATLRTSDGRVAVLGWPVGWVPGVQHLSSGSHGSVG